MQIENTTGLYHFDVFKEQAQKALADDPSHQHYVITINVSNFKFINQTYGYVKGDFLLKRVAEFFCYEEPSCYAACREYADHFVIFGYLKDISKEGFYDYMIQRIGTFHKSIVRAYPLFEIHLNIGGYLIEDNSMDIAVALDRAELARRSIKGNYTVSLQMYTDELLIRSREEAAIIPLFNRALEEGWIFAYLQPKIEIETGKLIGAEALARMVDENGKIVPPALFVEKLEEAGIIYQCDLKILELVLSNVRKWIDEGRDVVPISINLSRVDFQIKDFLEMVRKLFEKYQVPREFIEFEVTETAFVEELDRISELVKDIQQKGFKISVDDFGSGYSSLSAVSIMPVDTIKLDRSFVQNCIHSERGEIVIRKMVEMFKQLHLNVICEGVETQEEEKKVFDCGVRYVQGYVYDKPLPTEEFENKYLHFHK